MRTSSVVTEEVAASVITEARMGPTQGVQRIPSDNPIVRPETIGEPLVLMGECERSPEVSFSQRIVSRGMMRVRPKMVRMATAMILRKLASRPVSLTMVERAMVKIVKLAINPKMIPSDLWRLLVLPVARRIGWSGRIQGERIVTMPARKANMISISIEISIPNSDMGCPTLQLTYSLHVLS